MKKQIFLALVSSIVLVAQEGIYAFDIVPEYEKTDSSKVSGSMGVYYESRSSQESYSRQTIKINMQVELGSGVTSGVEVSAANGDNGFEGMRLNQMWVKATI